jgi:hypothetical protein
MPAKIGEISNSVLEIPNPEFQIPNKFQIPNSIRQLADQTNSKNKIQITAN